MSEHKNLKTLSSNDTLEKSSEDEVVCSGVAVRTVCSDSGASAESDESLLIRMIENKQAHAAFSTLVDRYHKRFYGAAYHLLGSKQEAEDIVQDSFLKLWRKPQIWKSGKNAKFSTWFYQIILNECRMFWRKRKNSGMSSFKDDAHFEKVIQNASQNEHLGAEELLAKQDRQQRLEQAIQSLPNRQKEALTLCFYEALSNKEAADVMNIQVKALESLLMRGKKQLKGLLKQ